MTNAKGTKRDDELRTLLAQNKNANEKLVRDSLEQLRELKKTGVTTHHAPRGQVSPYARRQMCKVDKEKDRPGPPQRRPMMSQR